MKNILLVFVLFLNLLSFSQENLEIRKAENAKKRVEMIEIRNQLIEARKQVWQDRNERIKSLKIAFISQKLALTSDEAEKFWPIYNKYDEKIMVLKEEQLKLKFQKRNLSGEEALKKIEESEEKEAEIMTLKKKMRSELIPVISAEKVLKLEQLEQEFHRKLLEKLKGRRGNMPPPRR